jgi:hypothetical protein
MIETFREAAAFSFAVGFRLGRSTVFGDFAEHGGDVFTEAQQGELDKIDSILNDVEDPLLRIEIQEMIEVRLRTKKS